MDLALIQNQLSHTLAESNFSAYGEHYRGKVRDTYRVDGQLILVTSDRISAFDHVLRQTIPFKGQVLNQLSAFWFERTADIVANHVIDVPDPNVTVAHECEALPVEVIVRGYITGVTKTALWYRYNLGEREIYGHAFPEGLQKNQKLPEAIITPTTKGGPTGHDPRLVIGEPVNSPQLTLRRGGAALAGGTGMGLFAASYAAMDSYIDTAHSDSCFLLCALSGCAVIHFRKDRAARIAGLILLIASFWFKQHGALYAIGGVLFLSWKETRASRIT